MISSTLAGLLREIGISEKSIRNARPETQLVDDLGVYGDEAIDFVDVLSKKFDVDVSELDIDRYFPLEFPGQTLFHRIVFAFVPFIRSIYYRRTRFEPISLEMIERAISSKKWPRENWETKETKGTE